ncbi:MAG: bifunctional 5,10-methylene-tetrahydrofolate dehydrogenase/5,10-methylene-tetrahydrofolate cyclohydrolase [Puniceicoccales bacterium]|jgi:methylenetetrahydrofolate dehydrogenase (NADP+)/methenyltetrahydrofolate cyclohydrolase|nr:bifunctional 5,10-methylene-tetrahydrofolate dehydrogenase/5,10-methylene-tetrahydrofolate cyclohydrolase [Puniceicoccales bacterium]
MGPRAQIIDGKKLAEALYRELRLKMQGLEGNPPPALALVCVGEHPESRIYLRQKRKAAESLGIRIQPELLPAEAGREEIFATIDRLNMDSAVHGILVQSPLPRRSLEVEVFNRVAAEKDVDGFGALNLGKLCQGDFSGFWPCTPAGVHRILRSTGIPIQGKHAVILGRSLIVGKPLGLILLQRGPWADATVSLGHSKSQNLAEFTRQADILVSAMGQPARIKASMLKPGAIVIDVGLTRVPDPGQASGHRLQGDVDFDEVAPVASFLTPVPGGVGPMTIAELMANTLKAYERQTGWVFPFGGT